MTFKIGIALEKVKEIWISCHSCSTASAAEGKRKLDTKGNYEEFPFTPSTYLIYCRLHTHYLLNFFGIQGAPLE